MTKDKAGVKSESASSEVNGSQKTARYIVTAKAGLELSTVDRPLKSGDKVELPGDVARVLLRQGVIKED